MPQRSVLCAECKKNIEPVVSRKISITSTYDLVVYAFCKYNGPAKSLILQKNRQDPLASYQLGRLIAENLELTNLMVDYLIPVPLHWTRYARRGFNQAEVIAHEIAKKVNAPVACMVKRTKRTPFQSLFSGPDRFKNVKEVFELDERVKAQFVGKHLVIVDDLMTTGATLQTVAKKLLALKPASISAIVGCRV